MDTLKTTVDKCRSQRGATCNATTRCGGSYNQNCHNWSDYICMHQCGCSPHVSCLCGDQPGPTVTVVRSPNTKQWAGGVYGDWTHTLSTWPGIDQHEVLVESFVLSHNTHYLRGPWLCLM